MVIPANTAPRKFVKILNFSKILFSYTEEIIKHMCFLHAITDYKTVCFLKLTSPAK